MASDLLSLNLTGPPDTGPTASERALVAGFAGAAASLVVSAVLWWSIGTPLLPLRVADAIFAVVPIWLVEAGVSFLGPWAKRFAFAGCVAGEATILAFAAQWLVRARPKIGLGDGLTFSAAVWLAASLTIVPIVGGGLFGVRWPPNGAVAAAALLASGLAYGAGMVLALRRLEHDDALARRASRLVGRRSVLGGLVAAGVAVVVVEAVRTVADFVGFGSTARVSGGSGIFPEINGLSREITPVADFYTVSKNVFDPEGPPPGWRLEVGGLVDRPLRLTLDDVRARPPVDAYATLACISNTIGGDLVGNARWRGVSLAALLGEAGVQAGAVDLVLTALDDYTDSIPIEHALDPGSLLAYEMNGAPLNATHGAPLRLVVPGIYGMKNVKWITRLDVVASDYKGYWQRRGWDDRAPYQTLSRIDVARAGPAGEAATIAGIAFAGDRGVSRVEVSTDGGATWIDAELRAPLSPNAWVLWHAAWTPPAPGGYTIVVRATDGHGVVQPRREAPPIPSGATGWHALTVTVK